MQNAINWIVENWDKIPDNFKSDLHGHGYSCKVGDIPGLKIEEHIVVLLLDRQKPSVIASYDFDEERIGVTKDGKVIWGFDSGCSCPSPWYDSYPGCYSVAKEWKEFEINIKQFDEDWEKECLEKVEQIKLCVK